MKKNLKYKIIIGILSFIIILQWLSMLPRPKKPARVGVALKGRIAIVLDDWGYNLDNLHIVGRINSHLTISVLPNLNYSDRVARELSMQGFEIILHLPMEPHEKYRLEKNTILTDMDEAAIMAIIDNDLASVLHAKGVSNHMGSLATEDERTMGIVFKELKKRHLYFLDSRVSSGSVCVNLARKLNLGFAGRDVFLDNEGEPEYIKAQIYKLKMKAKLYGQAIGICHDRKSTLEVLAEVIPQLEREGYKFVFVSELVR